MPPAVPKPPKRKGPLARAHAALDRRLILHHHSKMDRLTDPARSRGIPHHPRPLGMRSARNEPHRGWCR
eukprot:5671691-Prymnesium_polylepis.1